MTIINKTFDYLMKEVYFNKKINIKNIEITEYMTHVFLSDGSYGSSLDFSRLHNKPTKEKFAKLKNKLIHISLKDPLLFKTLIKEKKSFFLESLKVSIVSALSQKLLNKNMLNKFKIKTNENIKFKKLIKKTDNITFIGFSDKVENFLEKNIGNKIYISDFNLKKKEQNNPINLHFKQRCKTMKSKYPENYKKLIFTQGNTNKEILNNSDVVFITGSTLCNKTLDQLLKDSQNCREIIIEGPSASIFPLFILKKANYIETFLKTSKEFTYLKTEGVNFNLNETEKDNKIVMEF